jgi:hypothetical protein
VIVNGRPYRAPPGAVALTVAYVYGASAARRVNVRTDELYPVRPYGRTKRPRNDPIHALLVRLYDRLDVERFVARPVSLTLTPDPSPAQIEQTLARKAELLDKLPVERPDDEERDEDGDWDHHAEAMSDARDEARASPFDAAKLKAALVRLVEATENFVSSDPLMPSHAETESEFEAAIAAAKEAIA